MVKIIDMVGKRSGRLTIVRRAPNASGGKAMWVCVCDCGSPEFTTWGVSLRNGTTQSCGCLIREGLSERRFKHGRSRTPVYIVWCHMHRRCRDPKDKMWERYGGRGIKVCNRWNEFGNFIADMGERPTSAHTLERRDNDKGYGPDNCFWATRKEQSRNRGNFHIWVAYKGKRVQLVVAIEMAGNRVKYHTAKARIYKGWDPVRAIEEEV